MKKARKKILASVIIVAMLFTFGLNNWISIPVKADGEQTGQTEQTEQTEQTVTVKFDGDVAGDSGNQTVTYTVGDKTVVMTVTSTIDTSNNSNKALITVENENTLKGITLDDNFDSYSMEIKISGSDNFSTMLTYNSSSNTLTKESIGGFPDGTLTLVVQAKSTGNNDNQNNDNQGNSTEENSVTNFELKIKESGKTSEFTVNTNGENIVTVQDDDLSDGVEFEVTAFKYLDDNSSEILLTNVGNSSTSVKDSDDRLVLEIHTISQTKLQWVVGLEYHAENDETNKDKGCPNFYFINLTFVSSSATQVQISTGAKPDMYDDTVYSDKVVISDTTISEPAKTAVYYGSKDFTLADLGTGSVSAISLVSGFNPNAVTINNNNKITFNSGYYASIPLKVTMSDGTEGYLTVDRLGIEVDCINTTNRNTVYHGSQNGSALSSTANVSTYNIVAVFYYDSSKSYSNYDIVANLTYSNGTTETKIVSGFGEKTCASSDTLKGGDYLIWSGTSASLAPVSVSVTAVAHDAMTSDSFGGALFGAGAGVTKSVEFN